jgi:hypothetical protein
MNIHIIILYIICVLIILFIAYHYNKLKEITEIDNLINFNFEETNKKLDEVNKTVSILDESLEKANKIEKDVEELKLKVH